MKYLIIALSLLIVTGCTTLLKLTGPATIWLGHDCLLGLHFKQSDKVGMYDVIFNAGFSGGPIKSYRLVRINNSNYELYKLYIYASLTDNKPETGVCYDNYPGLVRVVLEMPDYRIGIDKLVIVDSKGEYPIDYQE
jgi:hypothetical protein